MMTSTRPPLDVAGRSEPGSSRRSISSQAASASRALASAASTSVSTPYAGLPSSSSSSSSSSSLSSSTRRSISSIGRNSLSRHRTSLSTTTQLANDDLARPHTRRAGSASSSSIALTDVEVDRTSSSSLARHRTNTSDTTASGSAIKTDAPASSRIQHTSRHQRHQSAETLRLDLDGLDLGGNQSPAQAFDAAPADDRRVRSTSNNAAIAAPFSASRPDFIDPFSKPVDMAMHHFCVSCPPAAQNGLHGLEDSFSLHLRAECSEYRQITPAQVVLTAAADRELLLRNPGLESPDAQRQRGYSISHGQVLGGFASLGTQTEAEVGPLAPPTRRSPVRTDTKRSSDSSEPPATPFEWRDSFGPLGTPNDGQTTKWAHLTSRPCNPLEPLDVLSIQEMGFHSLDVGSLNDWEGCKLSAEIMCPVNGHQRIEWSVAQTTRRNKKWVVVPNPTLTRGVPETLSAAVQAERTVVVSARSIWLEEASASPLSQMGALRTPQDSAKLATKRNSRPFSGKAGFELRLLRPTSGRICPPVYLANASTHRHLHQYRTENGAQSLNGHVSLVADRLSPRVTNPVYPVLRRSRSRPYLRHQHVPLRRSRSKPYLKHSAAQQEAAEAAASRATPEDFAPSLPGDPLLRMHPGESWPSARSRRTASRSSFDSSSSSDAESDTSSDGEGFSAPKTHESTSGSASSASYDHARRDDAALVADPKASMLARSAAVPMAASANRPGRTQHSTSPGSAASCNISSASERSAAAQRYGESASGETESWEGTSPTTASALSASTSSKQSRSRKGLQRALQKKDKMLSSWFKRRPDAAAASLGGQMAQGEMPSSLSPSASALPSPTTAHRSLNGNYPARTPRESGEGSTGGAGIGPTPLTVTALETFQRSMFRPASPESTVMGSRRGSEALTQKTLEPGNATVGEAAAHEKATMKGAASISDPAAANRAGVSSTLSALYGWDHEQAASKLLDPRAGSTRGSVCSTQGSSYQDLDEQNALLGIDAVPAGALTMLLPLPLIGRRRAQDAVRYMRVNFVPFGSHADSFESQSSATGPLSGAGSPGMESESGLSHSTSTGSGSLAASREAQGTGNAKSSEQSNWKRKLGLSGRNGAGAIGQNGASTAGGQSGAQGAGGGSKAELSARPAAASGPEAFRITAIVHDAPWTTARSKVDARLPEPGTFPVVLGYCNGSKELEMVPEGWAVLCMAGVPTPTQPDGSALEGVHPLHGVADVIIAACTAVMDV